MAGWVGMGVWVGGWMDDLEPERLFTDFKSQIVI